MVHSDIGTKVKGMVQKLQTLNIFGGVFFMLALKQACQLCLSQTGPSALLR